eukprot:3749829-Rhodomonas_salina.4
MHIHTKSLADKPKSQIGTERVRQRAIRRAPFTPRSTVLWRFKIGKAPDLDWGAATNALLSPTNSDKVELYTRTSRNEARAEGGAGAENGGGAAAPHFRTTALHYSKVCFTPDKQSPHVFGKFAWSSSENCPIFRATASFTPRLCCSKLRLSGRGASGRRSCGVKRSMSLSRRSTAV